jgi:hypothetical protein
MDQSEEGVVSALCPPACLANLHAAVQQAADEELISSASWIHRAIWAAVRESKGVHRG